MVRKSTRLEGLAVDRMLKCPFRTLQKGHGLPSGASVAGVGGFGIAVLSEPSRETAPAAHRAQPAFGGFPGSTGRDDEQFVAGDQPGIGLWDECLAITDDQADDGGGGKPELEQGDAVQLGPGWDRQGEQLGVEAVQGCRLDV
jgi:hypothetical protein